MSLPFLLKFIRGQLFRQLPIPTASYAGKTVIVTGSNVGLGLEASKHFARLGAARIVLAVRNVSKGEAAKESIIATTRCKPNVVQVWQLDMASYESVRQFAERASRDLPRIDALVLNAGISTVKYTKAEDNESTITVNVVSTALLALLMLPKLEQTAEQYSVRPNVVIVSSSLHTIASFPERSAPHGKILAVLNDPTTAAMSARYNVSKLLSIYATRALAARTGGASSSITINAVCPGFCASQLGRESDSRAQRIATTLIARSTEHGSRALVYAASAGAETHGQYLQDCRVSEPGELVRGPVGEATQEAVWAEVLEKIEAASVERE